MAVSGCGCVDGGGGECEGRGAVLDQIDDLMWEWEVMGTHVGHRFYQQPTCTSNRHGQQSGQLGPTGTACWSGVGDYSVPHSLDPSAANVSFRLGYSCTGQLHVAVVVEGGGGGGGVRG